MRYLILAFLLAFPGFAFALQADTELVLSPTYSGQTIEVSIQIKNPSKQEIRSVASYLEYDTAVLKKLGVTYNEDAFSLQAPPNPSVKGNNAIIPIERSAQGTGIHDEMITVATVSFSILKNTPTSLSFYNYQVGNDGNTVVFGIEDGYLVNILKEKPENIRLLEGNIPTESHQSQTSNNETPSKEEVANVPKTTQSKHMNITGVASGRDFAYLTWNQLSSPAYLYYGTQPGNYLFRKNVGTQSSFTVDNLQAGKKYYFQLVSAQGQNTQVSPEVSVVVGKLTPISTTHQVAAGPEYILLASIFITLGFVFRRKIWYTA